MVTLKVSSDWSSHWLLPIMIDTLSLFQLPLSTARIYPNSRLVHGAGNLSPSCPLFCCRHTPLVEPSIKGTRALPTEPCRAGHTKGPLSIQEDEKCLWGKIFYLELIVICRSFSTFWLLFRSEIVLGALLGAGGPIN